MLSSATLAHWLVLLSAVPILGVAHELIVGFGASHSRGAAVRWRVNQPEPARLPEVSVNVTQCIIHWALLNSRNF